MSENIQNPVAVDPWDLQKKLMTISAQSTPDSYQLNNDALMYSALIMEESSELYQGLSDALENYTSNTEGQADLSSINKLMLEAALFNHNISTAIRGIIKQMAPVVIPLTIDTVREIADGTTDIQVVNSGFSIATGLPGARLYKEVVVSNLSKANPETGIIDKEPDGKWIKGSEFVKPDIANVLYGYESP